MIEAIELTRVYLDHASTTPVRREVLEAMFPYFQEVFANPSSVHSEGMEAATALAWARSEVAQALGAHPNEIVFTSSGTESDNLAVIGGALARKGRGNHVIISTIEHEAVLRSAEVLEHQGFRITRVNVDQHGCIDPERVAAEVGPETVLVSCMYANNEVGTIQPVRDIVNAIRLRNPAAHLHTDGIQAAGALPLDVHSLDVDYLSLSGHKIYGPRGAGVLFKRRGRQPVPLSHGGGQEGGLRSGTENLPAIVGMATALALAEREREQESARLVRLRNRLTQGLLAVSSCIRLTGATETRLPGHASFVLLDRSAESVLVDLDHRGIMCSSGSACHAGMTDPSHVLLAMGLSPQQARNGLRMTLGRDTSGADIERTIVAMAEIYHAATVKSAVPSTS